MYNPGDDDIELSRLSREAANGYQAPGVPDWESLEARLDKVLPEDKKRRRLFFLWWLLPSLLVAGIAGWYLKGLYADKSTISTAQPVIQHEATAPTVTAQTPAESYTSSVPTIAAASPAGNETPSATGFARIPLIKNNYRSSKTAHRNEIPVADKRDGSDGSQTAGSDKSVALANRSTKNENNNTNNSFPPVSENRTTDADAIAQDPVAITPTSVVLPKAVEENKAPAQQKDSAIVTTAPVVTVKNKSKHNPFLSFAVIGGVDKSTVKFRYDYEPGYNLGLLAGYHFSKSLSLHTGAIFTQKNYKMAGTDFTAPKGSWASYYKLETVDGYCRMWEVPLELRYTINKNGRTGIFFGAGISSYFMTSENYNYDYYWMGQLASKTIGYNSTASNVLSIASLSAGFEQRISPTMFLQIQPYAKIPLDKMGSGSFRLTSFGVNFAAQFRQGIRKH